MFDIIVLFFFKNTILITLLFWILTCIGSNFFQKNESKEREDFYECGFKTTTDLNFSLNFSFFLSSIFLILYDLELVFLIAFLFNNFLFSINAIFTYLLLLLCIYITFLLDTITGVIEWNF